MKEFFQWTVIVLFFAAMLLMIYGMLVTGFNPMWVLMYE